MKKCINDIVSFFFFFFEIKYILGLTLKLHEYYM